MSLRGPGILSLGSRQPGLTIFKRGSTVPTLSYTTGQVAWFKADAITGKTDGQTVTSWVDSSGNGKTATEGTNPPTYKTGILNGLPVVRFTRAASTKLTSTLANNSAQFSVFMVAKFTGTTASVRIADWGIAKAGVFYNATGPQFSYFSNNADATVNLGGTPSAFTILEFIYTDATSCLPYVAGVAGSAFDPKDNYAVGTTNPLIFGFETSTGSADCDIAEFIAYSATLNNTNRLIVENYLKSKYAL